jgi:hypothetical protein
MAEFLLVQSDLLHKLPKANQSLAIITSSYADPPKNEGQLLNILHGACLCDQLSFSESSFFPQKKQNK